MTQYHYKGSFTFSKEEEKKKERKKSYREAISLIIVPEQPDWYRHTHIPQPNKKEPLPRLIAQN